MRTLKPPRRCAARSRGARRVAYVCATLQQWISAMRRVYLSISKHRRRPRRYRGRDLTWWWTETGALNLPVEQRGRDQSPMVFTGAYGGHTVDFRRFASEGMVLLGRTEAVQYDVMFFAPDLLLSLSHGDAA